VLPQLEVTEVFLQFHKDALPEFIITAQEQCYKNGSSKQKNIHIYSRKAVENFFSENEDVTTVLSAARK